MPVQCNQVCCPEGKNKRYNFCLVKFGRKFCFPANHWWKKLGLFHFLLTVKLFAFQITKVAVFPTSSMRVEFRDSSNVLTNSTLFIFSWLKATLIILSRPSTIFISFIAFSVRPFSNFDINRPDFCH